MGSIRSNQLLCKLQKFQRCLPKKFSSITGLNTATSDDNRQNFVCQEQNPEEHCVNNLGEFYTVPAKTATALFAYGIPKASFLDEVKTTGDLNIMVREPAVSILQKLKSDESLVKKFVIYGQDGCGKTITLSHILHYCYSQKWCILLIPSVFKIVNSKFNILPSSYNPERFDQPDEALSWLKTFQSLNEKHLAQIKTTKEYKVGQKISIDIGKPITTLIKQAFHRPNFATDAVGITIKEIQKLNGKFPVLFAADEFNGLFWTTSLKNPQTNNWLKPQDLSLVHHFEKLFKIDSCLEWGSYVMALSRTGMEKAFSPSYNHLQLLRQRGQCHEMRMSENLEKGVSCIGSYEPIEVAEYSEEELRQCLRYYQHKCLISKDINRPKTFQEIAFLTDRRPSLVKKMCSPF